MKQISEFMAKLDAMDAVALIALVIGYIFICYYGLKALLYIDDKDDYNKGEGKL